MQGLEISRRFFLEWGLPFLREQFPQLVTRLAAGKIGGSDCLGADDSLSRDHDWGPVFMLWLDSADYGEYGAAVRQRIDEHAPDSFLGYSRPGNSYTAEVHSREKYFDEHVGRHAPPGSGSEWMPDAYGEESLYDITHGSIYYDPTGSFETLRQRFAVFARDPVFRLRRMVDTCFGLWHYGEYNFLERVAHRDDAVPLHLCLAKFVENVMRQGFYLNREYCPYWKWLHHEFLKLPGQEEVIPLLDRLVRSRRREEQVQIVGRICVSQREMLLADGMVQDSGSSGLFGMYTAMQQQVEELRASSQAWWDCPSER